MGKTISCLLCAAAIAVAAPDPARILFLTTRPGAEHPLAGLLARSGFQVDVKPFAALASALPSDPDLIMAAPDTKEAWRALNEDSLAVMLGNRKVLAMGSVAEQLYDMLGLAIHDGAYGFDNDVNVAVPAVLAGPRRIANSGGPIVLWPPTQKHSYEIGIPKGENPPGLEIIARGVERHGSAGVVVVRQGNFAHWGFEASLARMTEQGRDFFVNVVAYLISRPAAPLSQVRPPEKLIPPGHHIGKFTKADRHGHYYFRLAKPGPIQVSVEGVDPRPAFKLYLIGPGSDRPLAEAKGPSPLKLRYEVKPEDLAKGARWTLAIHERDRWDMDIDYAFDISWP